MRAAYDDDARTAQKWKRGDGGFEARERIEFGCDEALEVEVAFGRRQRALDQRPERAIGKRALDPFDDDEPPDRRRLVEEIVKLQRTAPAAIRANAAKLGRIARSGKTSRYGGRATPYSVTIAAMRWPGVTSNAGL